MISEEQTYKIETLMLIDDNKIDQMLYDRIIKRSGLVRHSINYTMAQEALDYLRRGEVPQPDLILLDINMPQMDGFEFLDAATQELGADFCPVVVMLTTSLDPQDQERAERVEAVKRFLNKPLTQQLLEELSALV